MRILLIGVYYLPSSEASAKLLYDLGKEFQRQKHEVTILAPSESITPDLEVTQEDDLQIVRVKTGQIKGAARVLRAWREIRLSATLWSKGKAFFKKHPHDLVLFYSPSIFFGPLVARLKALWRCPAYLILRDIFPQWAVDVGVLKKGPIWAYFRWMELKQYAAANVIGVQSPANLKYFDEQLSHKNYQLEVLYNWTTTQRVEPVCRNYRQQLGLEDKIVFFYGGNIGVAQDMDNILRLAERLRNETQIYFLLVGAGTEVERLQALIQAKALTNICILPAVGQEEYQAMLSEFDVGLISLDRRMKTQNYPGKILGYMAAAKPILGTINPGNDLADLLTENGAGFCSQQEDEQELYEYALKLANDAQFRQHTGANARRLLERYFSVSVCASQILSHFQTAPHFAYHGAAKTPMERGTAPKIMVR
ncbi:MAG TPA: glycosyltransferase family 4 protein [Blastocatellia bacterium]|nr:glycosyltransferase family 4 protein [Blastocatellia bacterium]